MKVIELMTLATQEGPPTKYLTVIRTDDDWLWIHKLVLQEGYMTPFSSIEEIEIVVGQKLRVVKRVVTPNLGSKEGD